MTEHGERPVKKLWSYCNVLRDAGLSYQDSLGKLTFLLFLKMAEKTPGTPLESGPGTIAQFPPRTSIPVILSQ